MTTYDQKIISTNKIDTTSSKEIQKIESRHGITYFINYSKKAFTLRTDMMKQNTEFNLALEDWITKNNLKDKVASNQELLLHTDMNQSITLVYYRLIIDANNISVGR